jgi:hypothetical protein
MAFGIIIHKVAIITRIATTLTIGMVVVGASCVDKNQ